MGFSRTAVLSVVLAGSLLAGCARTQFESDPATTPVVPLNEVIGSMKCGLARAIAADKQGRTGLLAGTAKVIMKVNVVEGRSAGGKISVGIPIATAGTFTPGFSLSRDQTRTNNSTIKFNFDLHANNDDVCGSDFAFGHDAGFSGWIGQVVESLNATVAGAPKVSMQSYEYDSDFVVTSKLGLSGEFAIVPVKGSASYDSSRSDIQHLNITIAAVHVVSSRPGPGGPWFHQTFVMPAVPSPKTGDKPKNPCDQQGKETVLPGGKPFDQKAAC